MTLKFSKNCLVDPEMTQKFLKFDDLLLQFLEVDGAQDDHDPEFAPVNFNTNVRGGHSVPHARTPPPAPRRSLRSTSCRPRCCEGGPPSCWSSGPVHPRRAPVGAPASLRTSPDLPVGP